MLKSQIVKNAEISSKKSSVLKFSLVGNPNSGKTTLFNRLTGNTQSVGNWPGVTVEKKEGKAKFRGNILNILDLPGIYSLSPYSPEEVITRNSLLIDTPDVIINVVDATNLQRNLYLTTQIIEFGMPMVVALNMIDVLEKRKDKIEIEKLEENFGVKVVPISASKGKGLEKLVEAAINSYKTLKISVKNFYSGKIRNVLANIENIFGNKQNRLESNFKRFYAVKIFEDDQLALNQIEVSQQDYKKIKKLKSQIKTSKNIDRQVIIADERYKYICQMCERSFKRNPKNKTDSFSDKIDKILINRFLAFPIFFLMIFCIFFITFGSFGNFFKEKVEFLLQGPISDFFLNFLNICKASDWTKSLVKDGILSGIGAAVSFLPQIIILFTLLSLLEDTGYMARCAFIMDRIFKKLGLSGRSFVPMLIGFGCNVPAVMGTRIIEKEKDKKLTIFIIPFMSCSAKITIYALMAPVFFGSNSPFIIFGLYLLGIFVAFTTVFFMNKFLTKGKRASFVMELPPYRFPTFNNVFIHVWESVKDFLKRAGTVLASCSIIIWFLETFDFRMQVVKSGEDSIIYNIASFLAPIFTPCGFGNWRSSVALVAGIAAKESVVSTMAVLCNSNNSSELAIFLSNEFSKASALSFMVFVLFYTPCIAVISAIKREFQSTKWTSVAIFYQIIVAWVMSSLVFFVAKIIFK
ncbi:MAG: ferrous iron transport protein B [Oscillospiraceae bacterium]|jgi:ferrous iron transport protein B|nr:ferrous iron transport protein B [Oscillospiraceae bacterium]